EAGPKNAPAPLIRAGEAAVLAHPRLAGDGRGHHPPTKAEPSLYALLKDDESSGLHLAKADVLRDLPPRPRPNRRLLPSGWEKSSSTSCILPASRLGAASSAGRAPGSRAKKGHLVHFWFSWRCC